MDWVLTKLQELRNQFADGESQLVELERRQVQVHDSMLRVAGAILVLEELVAASGVFETVIDDDYVGATTP